MSKLVADGVTGERFGMDEFAAFMSARYATLVRSAYLLVGDRGRAEDLEQSALYRTLRSWDRLRAPESAEAYTRTTMVRLAGRWGQRHWRGELPDTDPDRRTSSDSSTEIDTALDTARALATLSRAAGLLDAATDSEVSDG